MIPSPAKLEEIEVTYRHALRIWWAILWRTALLSALSSLALDHLESSAARLLLPGELPTISHWWSTFCLVQGAILAALIGVAILRLILRRHFDHFRIVLAKHQSYYTEPF
ncbi:MULTISPECIES: hypothetical protein [unclassified Paludibacterium]|uniref:hypothetical protein n=1 Tax=unclassified Paludibacterium TaxID=2618429 RepID=UPI001C03C9FE|nr:hypothetical protein [Paludibacterium sp. B53371]BEV71751.1 hypothetical protein THUN1379_12330 [Paludibacterium sp. THUN1379]